MAEPEPVSENMAHLADPTLVPLDPVIAMRDCPTCGYATWHQDDRCSICGDPTLIPGRCGFAEATWRCRLAEDHAGEHELERIPGAPQA